MDTITQGLLGSVTAQLGLRQRIGKDASWMAALAGIAADLDILVQPFLTLSGRETDDLTRTVFHRGLSHSLLIVPVLAMILAWPWWRIRRSQGKPKSFRLLYACAGIALLSHPLLDWTTSYGTQLFAPLTNRRFAIDFMPIIDIFYTPILIVTLAVCHILRKCRTDSGKTTLIIGWIGFALATGYILAGGLMHNRAIRILQDRLAGEAAIHRPEVPAGSYRAYPQIGTIFLWRVTRRDGNDWTVARVNLLFPDAVHWQTARDEQNVWTRRAASLDAARTYRWFAMDQIRTEYHQDHGRPIVEFHDMRYGVQPESPISLWALRIRFDEAGQPEQTERVPRYPQRSFGRLARQTWGQIWNP